MCISSRMDCSITIQQWQSSVVSKLHFSFQFLKSMGADVSPEEHDFTLDWGISVPLSLKFPLFLNSRKRTQRTIEDSSSSVILGKRNRLDLLIQRGYVHRWEVLWNCEFLVSCAVQINLEFRILISFVIDRMQGSMIGEESALTVDHALHSMSRLGNRWK